MRISPRNFFDILLVFVSFFRHDICFFHILSLSLFFFRLQITFCIYLLLALLIFLYYFHNNLLLYLVSNLSFFNNKFCHSFFIISWKNYKAPSFTNQIRIVHCAKCIIFAHIPKVKSVSTSFDISNSNIPLKVIAFCIKSWQPLQRYGSYLKPISLKYQ